MTSHDGRAGAAGAAGVKIPQGRKGTMESLGRYYDYVRVSMRLAGGLKWFLFAGWVLLPVCVQTIMHPTDAAGFG
jgi:hypothetical protein